MALPLARPAVISTGLRVLLAPARPEEPEARVVVDDRVVAQPAPLHDVMARGRHDGVVRPRPEDLAQELGDHLVRVSVTVWVRVRARVGVRVRVRVSF